MGQYNDHRMMFGMYIVHVYSILLGSLLMVYMHVCLPLLLLCVQDEMKLLKEEHEKELQEFKVDNSI